MLTIGDIVVDPPIMLAPMAGVSDRAFRAIAREQGATLCVTEMVNANALVHDSPKSLLLMELDPGERPVGIQIAGADPASMAEAARAAAAHGAQLVDINMGCPVAKIVANREGSALMQHPDLAEAVVESVVDAVSVPVTVKMRAGWDREHINAPELAERFERVGAKAVTVHARTRADQFARPADWSFIRQVKERVGIPVIGNGDIESAQDALRMMEETGADGAMIGRASFGDPWIFQRVVHYLQTGHELPPPSAMERSRMAVHHMTRLDIIYGPMAVPQMRKHLAWYLKGTPGSAAFRKEAGKLQNLADARRIIAEWLDHARDETLTWQ